MSSYQRQSSGYQNIPTINNDEESTQSTVPPMATPSFASGGSYNSSSHPSSLVNHVERLMNFILSKPIYIWLVISFLVLMITTSGFGHDGSKKNAVVQTDGAHKNSNNVASVTINENKQDEVVSANTASSSSFSSTESMNDEIYSSQDEVEEEDTTASSSSTTTANEKEGKLAYLLSYPNSGTTYTTSLVAALANKSDKSSSGSNAVASNYRSLCATDQHGHPFLVFQNNNNNNNNNDNEEQAEGPCYISGPSEKNNQNNENNHKSPSILTVSHCAGRCPYASINCPPSDYIETYQSFEQACRTTSQTSSTLLLLSGGETKSIYGSNQVSKAVHLYRDPLDNVVSRFHAARYEYKRNNKDAASKQWLQEHPNNKAGFLKWCEANDAMYVQDEQNSKFFPSEIMEYFPNIPCHDEFFRWIQFHNLANEVVEFRNLDSVVVRYEEYADDLSDAALRLGKFLGYDEYNDGDGNEKTEEELFPQFVYGNTYSDYYTEEQRTAIWKFLNGMAHPKVRDVMGAYE